jgi:hypothetical protein
MEFYKFIKIKGPDGANTGYFVPRMYKLPFDHRELKIVGLQFVKDRLAGWTVWWVGSEADYKNAIKTLEELKKTRIFTYKVSRFF